MFSYRNYVAGGFVYLQRVLEVLRNLFHHADQANQQYHADQQDQQGLQDHQDPTQEILREEMLRIQ